MDVCTLAGTTVLLSPGNTERLTCLCGRMKNFASRITIGSSRLVPVHRPFDILRHPTTSVVHCAEMVLRISVALVSRLAIPVYGFG